MGFLCMNDSTDLSIPFLFLFFFALFFPFFFLGLGSVHETTETKRKIKKRFLISLHEMIDKLNELIGLSLAQIVKNIYPCN